MTETDAACCPNSSYWSDSDEEEEELRQAELRRQVEAELSQRVAIALPETPPLERLAKRRAEAQHRQVIDYDELNAHLDFNVKFYHPDGKQKVLDQAKGRIFTNPGWPHGKKADNEGEEPGAEDDTVELERQARQFRGYSPIMHRPLGFIQSSVVIPERYGPAYLTPIETITVTPLLPPPNLINNISTVAEPLYTSIPYVLGSRTFENQVTPYTNKLRGHGVVYDSEKTPKEQVIVQPTNDQVAPSLIFESRFESGNLRQSRRVGQFEYDLVLNTDVFTRRHTQWYYFRVQNMVPNIIYKFRIVNLLKKDSLYNHGMMPLFYSKKNSDNSIGWVRHGHHISYARNVTHLLCPLLSREMAYFELEWQMEFPYANDTCYLAHCYPFSHEDLMNDLKYLTNHKQRRKWVKQEALCHTRAGNVCPILTITDPSVALDQKPFIVISGRVHPGESNASWMIKGLYDFLTSEASEAGELRRRFIFKVIPMLNPDGVIMGNYRCSLQGKDLNRNYRKPRKESFPTIWHIKNLVTTLQTINEVLVYCDFHGHSRKANVFMYGNSSNVPEEPPSIHDFINVRTLPFLLSQLNPDMFSFDACKFSIRRSKEATGRVVMYREFRIENCYTMEATFSGTKRDAEGARHYNQQDFMDAGSLFAKGVLKLAAIRKDTRLQSELILSLTKHITRQLIVAPRSKLLPTISQASLVSLARSSRSNSASLEGVDRSADSDSSADGNSDSANHRSFNNSGNSSMPKSHSQPNSELAQALDQASDIDFSSPEALSRCLDLLGNLSRKMDTVQSDSSDSDSDPEPEVKGEIRNSKAMKKKKNKKRNDKKKDGKRVLRKPDSQNSKNSKSKEAPPMRNISLTSTQFGSSEALCSQSKEGKYDYKPSVNQLKVLPSISTADTEQPTQQGSSNTNKRSEVIFDGSLLDKQKDLGRQATHYNPYQGRSNGGIPCFSEERCIERAAKRMAVLQNKMESSQKEEDDKPFDYESYLSELQKYDAHIRALNTRRLHGTNLQAYLRKSIRLLTQSCVPELDTATLAAELQGELQAENPLQQSAEGERHQALRSMMRGTERHPRLDPNRLPSTDYHKAGGKGAWQWYPDRSTKPNAQPDQLSWSLPNRSAEHQSPDTQMSRPVLLGHKVTKSGVGGFLPMRKQQKFVRNSVARLSLSGALKVNPLHQRYE